MKIHFFTLFDSSQSCACSLELLVPEAVIDRPRYHTNIHRQHKTFSIVLCNHHLKIFSLPRPREPARQASTPSSLSYMWASNNSVAVRLFPPFFYLGRAYTEKAGLKQNSLEWREADGSSEEERPPGGSSGLRRVP